MVNKNKRLAEAWSYLSFASKKGYLDRDPEELVKMTNEELIEYAEDLMNRGDYYASQ